MEKLEAKIGYSFKNKKFLETALTHSSYANERRNGKSDNERLEFLGDAPTSVGDEVFSGCNSLTIYAHKGTSGWYLGRLEKLTEAKEFIPPPKQKKWDNNWQKNLGRHKLK